MKAQGTPAEISAGERLVFENEQLTIRLYQLIQ